MLKRMLWRCAAIALIAGAGLGVRPASAQDDAGDSNAASSIDAQLGKLADQMPTVEKEFNDLPLAAEARCRESFARPMLDQLLLEKKVTVGVFKNLILGHTCRAVTAGNMAGCSDPDNLGAAIDNATDPALRKLSPATSCQNLYEELLRTQVLLTAKDSPAAAHEKCLAAFASTNDSKHVLGVDPNGFCEIYVTHADDTHQRMAALVPYMHHKTSMAGDPSFAKEVAEGEAAERYYEGQVTPAVCQAKGKDFSSTDGIASRQACTTAYYYRAAYSQSNADLCGKSGLCRAMMKQPHACDVYNDGARDAYCATLYPDLKTNKSEERLTKLSARVTSLKAKADELSGSLGSGARDANRRQMLATIAQKCATMERTLHDALAIHHDASENAQTMDTWDTPKR